MQTLRTGRANSLQKIYALVLLAIGLAQALPGAKLIALGGSWYYTIAGLATTASGILLWRGGRRGGYLYCLMLAGTVVWALWEVGLNGWALAPRLVAPAVLGLPLLFTLAQDRWGGLRVGVAMAAVLMIAFAATQIDFSAKPAAMPAGPAATAAEAANWPHYGNSQGGMRHSLLVQITPDNVAGLQPAWSTFVNQPLNGLSHAKFEVTPIKIGSALYVCTALNDIVALDAQTGRELWHHQSHTDPTGVPSGTCRGVAYYQIPHATGLCAERIYTSTVDARLLAVDAATGQSCAEFGAGGTVDLLKGMGQKIRGYYFCTSGPTVARGKLVIGGFVADGQSTGEPSGVIRAFDAVNGKLAWAWDMGNPNVHTEPAEGQTYTLGTPNAWAPMSADDQLGIVYVPTGNATPDYFGAYRTREMEEFTVSLVALDADTGDVRWHFQAVHHDVWDYDISVQPTLIDVPTRNGIVPAVAQGTKHGELFLLDRRTGAPIFPITERPTPQGPVAGDWLSPTQPHSSLPDSIGPILSERDMWGATPLDQMWCRIKFREARYEGPFTPMRLKPTIVQPGYTGGTEWGSVSFDPRRNLLVMASNYVVNYNRLMSRAETDSRGIHPSMNPPDIDWGHVPQAGTPYGAETVPFLSPAGIPCTQPPYSLLTAIDMTTGQRVWSQPVGTARSLGPYGIAMGLPFTIGTPTFGGAITTDSGLTFIAASLDHAIRAFDTATGRLLWQADLPADGMATPITYQAADGRQYLVIAIGDADKGMKASSAYIKNKSAGGTIMAFALPGK